MTNGTPDGAHSRARSAIWRASAHRPRLTSASTALPRRMAPWATSRPTASAASMPCSDTSTAAARRPCRSYATARLARARNASSRRSVSMAMASALLEPGDPLLRPAEPSIDDTLGAPGVAEPSARRRPDLLGHGDGSLCQLFAVRVLALGDAGIGEERKHPRPVEGRCRGQQLEGLARTKRPRGRDHRPPSGTRPRARRARRAPGDRWACGGARGPSRRTRRPDPCRPTRWTPRQPGREDSAPRRR